MGFLLTMFAVWVGLAIWVSVVAEKRNRSAVAFLFLSLFLSPVVAGVILGVLGEGRPPPDKSPTRTCPHCAETIKADARICRFCNRDVSLVQNERTASSISQNP